MGYFLNLSSGLLAGLCLLTATLRTQASDPAGEQLPAVTAQPENFFEERVAPLLIKRCIECHNGQDRVAGLDLTSAKGLAAGGESREAPGS